MLFVYEGMYEDGYIMIGFKVFVINFGVLDSFFDGQGLVLVLMVDDGMVLVELVDGCEYCLWGSVMRVKDEFKMMLLLYELVYFMLYYCVFMFRVLQVYWVCVCLW